MTAAASGSLALRLFLGAVFLYAGIVKVIDPAQFLVDVESYRLLPYLAALVVALYLPWLEIFCGAALWFKRWYDGAIVILLGLTVVFGVLIASAWVRGLDISCGCFGVSESTETNYAWWLLRDILLFAGLAGSLWLERFREDPARLTISASEPLESGKTP